MHFSSLSILVCVLAASIANAHFNITYPSVRTPFDDNNEVNFCDLATNANLNASAVRATFPLSNGVIAFDTSHPSWTAGVMISTSQNPTSFSDFKNSSGSDQLVVQYFQSAGTFGCITVNANASGIPGLVNGSNVTMQMVFNGGDGSLYQCMDVTLSSTFQVPSNVTSGCANHIDNPSSTSSGTSSTSTSSKTSSGVAAVRACGLTGLIGVLVAMAFVVVNLF